MIKLFYDIDNKLIFPCLSGSPLKSFAIRQSPKIGWLNLKILKTPQPENNPLNSLINFPSSILNNFIEYKHPTNIYFSFLKQKEKICWSLLSSIEKDLIRFSVSKSYIFINLSP